MENEKNGSFFCYDCKKNIAVENGELTQAKMLVYDNAGEKIKIVKCDNCYEKNPSLADFQKCEVYSRVVGYIRPIQQWNLGKKQEYREREEFDIPKDISK